jgi:glucokinase
LAGQLAAVFSLPLFDKDDILDALFDTLGSPDSVSRQRLSRASDTVLMRLAERSRGAVLTSFWRHLGLDGSSGTPCEWLNQLSGLIVEVYCKCPAEIAALRFRRRSRHPGHFDTDKSEETLITQFRLVEERGPLDVGKLIIADTSVQCEVDPLIRKIALAFACDDQD